MSDRDDARERILARRQRFISLALAGAGLAIGCDSRPQVCLEVAPKPTQSSDAGLSAPAVCLSVSPYPVELGEVPQPDQSADAEGAPSASATSSASSGTPPVAPTTPPRPTVCLRPPPPRPTVCLSPRRRPRVCLKIAPQPVLSPGLKPEAPPKPKSSG